MVIQSPNFVDPALHGLGWVGLFWTDTSLRLSSPPCTPLLSIMVNSSSSVGFPCKSVCVHLVFPLAYCCPFITQSNPIVGTTIMELLVKP